MIAPKFEDDDVQYCAHCGRGLYEDIFYFYDDEWFCDEHCLTEYIVERALDSELDKAEKLPIASAYLKREQWEKGYEEYLESTAYDDWKDSRDE